MDVAALMLIGLRWLLIKQYDGHDGGASITGRTPSITGNEALGESPQRLLKVPRDVRWPVLGPIKR